MHSQLPRVLGPFLYRHQRSPAGEMVVELVVSVAWCHVDVVMPDILITGAIIQGVLICQGLRYDATVTYPLVCGMFEMRVYLLLT